MIAKHGQKGKRIFDILLLPFIIILVAVGAFGLGRLSVLQAQKSHLIVYPPAANTSATSTLKL
ncbi:MAG: hypothetical protein KGH79_01265 [Patescibacteria group bacterium]|nr:hypothetical protein [Patescibacteria group bacterium]